MRFPLQVRKIQTFARDMQQIEMLIEHAPGRADAVVVQLAGFVRRVPALQYRPKLGRLLAGFVKAKPFGFNNGSAKRDRILLILARKTKFRHGAPRIRQGYSALAGWMQDVACVTPKPTATKRPLNQMTLLSFCNRREGQDV